MANIHPFEDSGNPGHRLAHILNTGNNDVSVPSQTGNEEHQQGNVHFADHHRHHHHQHHNHSANANRNGNGAVCNNGETRDNGDEMESILPAWALAEPVDGYIEHPVAGLIMHPSFYDNRHLINLATKPRYIYDGEVDGPLCPPSQKCTHIKNCFEVRVRMAVLAYRMHNISFRDAEYVWRVSRSTIQRRKAALDKRSPIIFLVTPQHPVT